MELFNLAENVETMLQDYNWSINSRDQEGINVLTTLEIAIAMGDDDEITTAIKGCSDYLRKVGCGVQADSIEEDLRCATVKGW